MITFERLVAVVAVAVALALALDNARLRERLSHSVSPASVAKVAEACESLVDVNRRCLAFSSRVKELLDVREEGSEQWARLWRGHDQVLSGAVGSQQGGSGRSR